MNNVEKVKKIIDSDPQLQYIYSNSNFLKKVPKGYAIAGVLGYETRSAGNGMYFGFYVWVSYNGYISDRFEKLNDAVRDVVYYHKNGIYFNNNRSIGDIDSSEKKDMRSYNNVLFNCRHGYLGFGETIDKMQILQKKGFSIESATCKKLRKSYKFWKIYLEKNKPR